MRPDIKLGVILSSVLVFVVGGYYLYSSNREAPIQVATTPTGADVAKSTAATPADAAPKTTPARPTGARPGVNAKRDPRLATRQPTGSATGLPTNARTPGGATTLPAISNQPRPALTPVSSAAPVASDSGASVPGGGSDPARTVLADSTGAAKPPVNELTLPPASSPSAAIDAANADGGGTVASSPPVPEPRPISTPPIGSGVDRSVPLTATSPPGAPGAGNVASIAVESHRVQAGDTLVSLAQRYYGDAALGAFLKESNPQLASPDQLRSGEVVRIPQRPANWGPPRSTTATRSDAPPSASKPTDASASPKESGPARGAAGTDRTYRVKPGDSFYKIAKDQLGDSARWKELFQLNKDRVGGDPTNLKIGQTIVLPGK